MSAVLGEKLKNFITGELFEVKSVSEGMIVLEACDGTGQVLTESESLNLFYDRMEKGKEPEVIQ